MDDKAVSESEPSHARILQSTALIGLSSIVDIAFGIVRSKVVAVLLGPSGVGLIGLYNSIADLTLSLANLGVPSSGVRQIAEAAGSGDAYKIARTATILKWVSMVLALLGALFLAAFAVPVSDFTFGSHHQAAGVTLLAAAVFFRTVSAGQAALIQGMRRISDLARMSMLAALSSTVISIPFIYFFGETGIVPSLVAMAAASALTSWWFSRRVQVPKAHVTTSEFWRETAMLLKLGIAFMVSAMLALAASYAIRTIVLRYHGIEAAGLYQAAWTLSGLYLGFILKAMGTDLYPRLAAVANDNLRCNRLANEQAYISMLIAGPGVVATLMLAPLAMTIFYSSEFRSAVELVRWFCLGMMLRIVAWPIGYIVLAKGAQHALVGIEVAAAIVHVGLAWLLVRNFGPVGSSIAFFALYVWHSTLVYLIVHRLSGFRWSTENLKLGKFFILAAGLTFANFHVFSFWLATLIGIAILLLTCIYSLRVLIQFCPPDILPAPIRRWLLPFM
jgi:antigen flippase